MNSEFEISRKKYENVLRFNRGMYNEIESKYNLTPIKKYIDTTLKTNCELKCSVLINKNGYFNSLRIDCYKKNSDIKPIIIIYPEERKFVYDHLNLHADSYSDFEIKRTKEQFINNNDIIKLFELIIIDCKETIKKSNDNINQYMELIKNSTKQYMEANKDKFKDYIEVMK